MKNNFCVNCGEKLKEGSVFCANCGAKIEKENKKETIDNSKVNENVEIVNNQTYNYEAFQPISRVEIKEEAKKIYKDNMWNIWKVLLINMGITLASGALSNLLGPLSFAITFLLTPITVGMFYYFINLVSGKEFKIDQLFEFYKKNMMQIILATLLVGIFTFLWSLLLFIPGIVAALSYSMVTYLLADGDTDDASKILKKSKGLMNGYKMDYFIFQLSFIGWYILCLLTCGILYIWIIPYSTIANILYLKKIKEIRS